MYSVASINRNYYTGPPLPPIVTVGNPVIGNFTIENAQPTRVYFNSSEIITASTVTGFTVSGKTISSVTIQSGLTTGHYFTVTAAFNFWDNNTIRYEGGSDIADLSSNGVYDFTMEHIINNIAEPSTSIDRFLSPNGSGSKNGLSEANAWSPAEITGLNVIAPNTTVWVKAGTYSDVTFASSVIYLKSSGTLSQPIKFIGYKTNPVEGDITIKFIDDFVYTTGTAAQNYFDPAEYPVIDGGGTLSNCIHSYNDDQDYSNNPTKYIIWRNIAVTDSTNYGIGGGLGFHVFDNMIGGHINDASSAVFTMVDDLTVTNYRVLECVAFNSGTSGILMKGSYGLTQNCRAYGSVGDGFNYKMDYTIGFNNCSNSIVKDCYIQEYGVDGIGHGYTLKSDDPFEGIGNSVAYNLFVENEVLFTSFHENLVFRRKDSHDNVAKRNVATKTHCIGRSGNGSYSNIWENNVAYECSYVHSIGGNGESMPWYEPEAGKSTQSKDNIVRNNIATAVTSVVYQIIKLEHPEANDWVFMNTGLKIYNNTITDISGAMIETVENSNYTRTGWTVDFSGSELKNNIFTFDAGNTDPISKGDFGTSHEPSNFTWDYNNWWQKPAGWTLPTPVTSQYTLDPQFVDEVDYVPGNNGLLVAPKITDVDYDYNKSERASTTTIGAVKLESE